MSNDRSARRRVQISFDCDFMDDGTPMWAEGHPEDVIRQSFVGVTDLRVEVDAAERPGARS